MEVREFWSWHVPNFEEVDFSFIGSNFPFSNSYWKQRSEAFQNHPLGLTFIPPKKGDQPQNQPHGSWTRVKAEIHLLPNSALKPAFSNKCGLHMNNMFIYIYISRSTTILKDYTTEQCVGQPLWLGFISLKESALGVRTRMGPPAT